MNKQKLKKAFKFVGIKALGAFIFVAVAGTSIWALAVFTEPTDTPGNSVQDFAKNIMGANNPDNAFDSSSVTANSKGSIVERLEDLRTGDYITCSNVYSNNYYQSQIRPSCPTNFVSVADGFWHASFSDTYTSNTYTGWRMCCLPR